jgi:hypothetical protein
MDDPSTLLQLVPGRLVRSAEGTGEASFWLSDGPAEPGLWSRLRAEHGRSGFWPLLLGAADDDGRPWETGEVWLDRLTSPSRHNPEAVLRTWWKRNATSPDELAPLGVDWPGGEPPTPPHRADPGEHADAVADVFLAETPSARLGLVAAPSGADALTAAGWRGPMNHTGDTAEISAVLRDWQRRYGARVVALDGDATLVLSVAAPAADRGQALRVAAEHFAFCPDNLWQGAADTLGAYADRLVGAEFWVFWWD